MSPKWYLARIALWPVSHLLGVKVIGREKIAKAGPLIVAANHKSYLDPPLVGFAVNRECFFMAKSGLFTVTKFFRWLITTYNAFPITGIGTIRRARDILSAGLVLVIFPEGTRALHEQLLSFHSGVGYLARKFQIPVTPVYIENSHRPLKKLILRQYCLRVVIGEAIAPPPLTGAIESDESFALKIRDRIVALSQTNRQ